MQIKERGLLRAAIAAAVLGCARRGYSTHVHLPRFVVLRPRNTAGTRIVTHKILLSFLGTNSSPLFQPTGSKAFHVSRQIFLARPQIINIPAELYEKTSYIWFFIIARLKLHDVLYFSDKEAVSSFFLLRSRDARKIRILIKQALLSTTEVGEERNELKIRH